MSYPRERAPRLGVVANAIGAFSPKGKNVAEKQMRALFARLQQEGRIAKDSILHPKRIFGPLEAEPVADQFARAKVDAVVILNSAFPNGNTFLTLANDPYLSRLPLIVVAPPEIRLPDNEWTTNAYCGLIMNNFVAKRLGRPMFAMPGWPEEADFYERFTRLLHVVYAIRELRRDLVGRIGDAPSGFHSATGDQLAYARVLGTRVETVDLSVVIEAYNTGKAIGLKGKASFTKAEVERTFKKMCGIGEVLVPKDKVRQGARLFHAFKTIIEANGFTSVSVRCWPELMTIGPKMAGCYAIAMLMNENVVRAAACEGDWPTTVGQSLGALLSGKPAACLDFVNDLAAKPIVELGHCGVGMPNYMVAPKVSDISSDRQAGSLMGPACIGQFEYGVKTGVCLMADPAGRFKLLAFTGENRPDTAQGVRYCAADVEVKNPRKLNELILEHGFPHHLAVVFADITQELKWFCQFHGIEYVSPDEA